MKETPADMVGGPEIFKLAAGDPYLELAEEIEGLVARRAYELFRQGDVPMASTGKTGAAL